MNIHKPVSHLIYDLMGILEITNNPNFPLVISCIAFVGISQIKHRVNAHMYFIHEEELFTPMYAVNSRFSE